MKQPDPPTLGAQGLLLWVSDTPYSSIPVDVIVVGIPSPFRRLFRPFSAQHVTLCAHFSPYVSHFFMADQEVCKKTITIVCVRSTLMSAFANLTGQASQ